MTITIPTIVEGQGEVRALPILLRRLGELYCPEHYLNIPPPHRLPRGKMTNRPDEFKRAVQLAAAKGGPPSEAFIIVLLDSDQDCAAEIGPRLAREAKTARSDFQITVSLAVREFECWILASPGSLNLPTGVEAPADPESVGGAKGWLKRNLPLEKYSETIDQPRLTSQIDIETARGSSPSFDRFCREFQSIVIELAG
ncbi:MAG: hypothetical protein ACI9NQ_000578 [Paracoccaceae bacterium]|jgi:hypothetical protein